MSPATLQRGAICGAVAIACCLPLGCGDQAPAVEDAAPLPVVDVAPHLLQDTQEIAAYVAAFPFEEHRQYHMPARCWRIEAVFACWRHRLAFPYVGRFWIEGPPHDLIKRIHVAGVVWEPHLIAALQDHVKPSTAAIDVGAYIGTHSLLMGRLVGSRGKVYAFEPQRKVYRQLVHNIALNDLEGVVVPLRYAVGADTRIVEMNPVTATTEGGASVGSGGERVELRPLDSFGFERVSLLKIDVEGFEKEVLAGAGELLRTSRPAILIEILGGAFYPGAPPTACCGKLATAEQLEEIHATWRLIEAHGYAVSPLESHNYIALPLEHADLG